MKYANYEKNCNHGCFFRIGLRVAEAFASRGVKVGTAARHTESMRELKKQYPDMIEYESIDVTHTNAPEPLEN